MLEAERHCPITDGIITRETPKLSVDYSQQLLDKATLSFPCIQEVNIATGNEYRRNVYIPSGNGLIHLSFERNVPGIIDVGLFAKSPGYRLLLLFPMKVEEERVIKVYRTRILERVQLLNEAQEGIGELQSKLIEECLTGSPSLEVALKEYPRIARRSIDPEFGIKYFNVHLLTQPERPHIVQ